MNKSKSIMNVDNEPQKKEKKVTTGNSKRNAIIASCIGGVLLIGLIILVFFDYLYKAPCVKIDGDSYNINDIEVRYNVYNAEAQVEMDALMARYSGSYQDSLAYWNVDGVRDNAKSIAEDATVRYLVMYKEAVAQGLSLTDKEKQESDKKATTFYDAMSKEHKKRAKFNLDELKEYSLVMALANKYIDQLKEGYNVSNETLDTPIKESDYDEIKFQAIIAPTTTGDSTTNEGVKLDDATIAKYKTQMDEYMTKAKAGDDLSTLVSEDDSSTYRYMETTLKRGTETYKTLLDALETLKNGELYGSVIDDGKALYIVKMVDKNSKESYENAVNDAVTSKEEELLKKDLNKLTAKYNVKSGSGWDDITMGEVVVYPEDSLNEFYAQPEESADPNATQSPDASAAPDASVAPSASAAADTKE